MKIENWILLGRRPYALGPEPWLSSPWAGGSSHLHTFAPSHLPRPAGIPRSLDNPSVVEAYDAVHRLGQVMIVRCEEQRRAFFALQFLE